MPTTYSPSLRLALIGDGEGAGTWGATTNTNLGSLLESAISGIAEVSVTSANVTLTANNGAADESRNMVISLIGTSTGARNIIVPDAKKLYVVFNGTTGGFAHTVKTDTGSGVAVPNGKRMILYCDGVNVMEAVNHATTLLPLSGGTMTGPIALSDGTNGAPSLTFASDTDTGFKWNSSGSFSVSINGSVSATFAATTSLSALSVSGATSFNGAVTNNSTLSQVGASTFTGAATFNGNVTLGDATGDALTVNATTTFAGPVSFTGVPTFYGNVVIGDTSGDTLTVVSTSTFSSGATFSSTSTFTGTATFNGVANFNGNVTLGNTAGDAITVTGAPTFGATATFNGNVVMNGNVTLGDATGDAITITGNTTVGSSTTMTKQSAGSFISHGSSGHSSGVITVSSSAPSGGSNGDIWFQI